MSVQSTTTLELPDDGTRLHLHCQDCLIGMETRLEPESVDVVVTSPPYNLGVKYDGYDDGGTREDYLAWTGRWLSAVRRVLSPGGSLFLNVGSRPRDPWVPFEVAGVAREREFVLQNVFHWVKSISVMKEDVGDYPGIARDVVVGHYKPINSPRFVNDCHEYVFHLTLDGGVPLDRLALGVPYQDKSNVRRWAATGGRDLHCRGNTWFIPYKTIVRRDRDRPHPATFPPKLPEMCLRLHGLQRIGLVLDPFLGLGSTALACIGLKRNFIGFELAGPYYREAVRRLRRAVNGNQPAEPPHRSRS